MRNDHRRSVSRKADRGGGQHELPDDPDHRYLPGRANGQSGECVHSWIEDSVSHTARHAEERAHVQETGPQNGNGRPRQVGNDTSPE